MTVAMPSVAETRTILNDLRHIGARSVTDRDGGAGIEITVRAHSLLEAEHYLAHRVAIASQDGPEWAAYRHLVLTRG
jgi:hypothetical protein